jgi:hypothetical protein
MGPVINVSAVCRKVKLEEATPMLPTGTDSIVLRTATYGSAVAPVAIRKHCSSFLIKSESIMAQSEAKEAAVCSLQSLYAAVSVDNSIAALSPMRAALREDIEEIFRPLILRILLSFFGLMCNVAAVGLRLDTLSH